MSAPPPEGAPAGRVETWGGTPSSAIASSARRAAHLATARLGLSLAGEGVAVKLAWAVAVLTVIGAIGGLARLAREEGAETFGLACDLVPEALAWGAGVLLAIGVAVHALVRDRERGLRLLLEARAVPAGPYLAARALGLGAWLFAMVGAGSVIVDLAGASLAPAPAYASRALASAVGALVEALALGLTLGPLAFATLGGRTRGAGYVRFLAVLAGPEVVLLALPDLGSPALREVASLPRALLALRHAVTPPGLDVALAARALAVLLVFLLVAMARLPGELARASAAKVITGPWATTGERWTGPRWRRRPRPGDDRSSGRAP